MKKIIDKPKLIPLYDIVKLYFSEYKSIKFSKIKKIIKKFKKELERYTDLSPPLWIEGRAKELSNGTLDFVEINKYLLSPDKDFFTYQEYHNLMKFELVFQNLSIISEQMEKLHSTELKVKNKKAFQISGIIGVGIILFFLCYADKFVCGLISFGLTIFIMGWTLEKWKIARDPGYCGCLVFLVGIVLAIISVYIKNVVFSYILISSVCLIICFNIKKIEVDVNPKIDSANKALESSLKDLGKNFS